MQEFKDRLKIARKKAKMTQVELAKAVNTSQGSIADLESGRNKTSTNILQLAQALEVDANWLATGQGQMTANSVNNNSNGAGIFDTISNTNHGTQIGTQHTLNQSLGGQNVPEQHSGNISVSLSEDYHNAVQSLATINNISPSEWIRRLIEKEVLSIREQARFALQATEGVGVSN